MKTVASLVLVSCLMFAASVPAQDMPADYQEVLKQLAAKGISRPMS